MSLLKENEEGAILSLLPKLQKQIKDNTKLFYRKNKR